jgi:hypothetical protein
MSMKRIARGTSEVLGCSSSHCPHLATVKPQRSKDRLSIMFPSCVNKGMQHRMPSGSSLDRVDDPREIQTQEEPRTSGEIHALHAATKMCEQDFIYNRASPHGAQANHAVKRCSTPKQAGPHKMQGEPCCKLHG